MYELTTTTPEGRSPRTLPGEVRGCWLRLRVQGWRVPRICAWRCSCVLRLRAVGSPETWAGVSAIGSLADGTLYSFGDEHRIRGRKIQLPSSRPPEGPLLGHVQHNLLLGELRGKAPGSFRSKPRYVSPDLAVLVDPQGDYISSLAWTVEVIRGLLRSDGDPDFRAQPLDLDRERIDG